MGRLLCYQLPFSLGRCGWLLHKCRRWQRVAPFGKQVRLCHQSGASLHLFWRQLRSWQRFRHGRGSGRLFGTRTYVSPLEHCYSHWLLFRVWPENTEQWVGGKRNPTNPASGSVSSVEICPFTKCYQSWTTRRRLPLNDVMIPQPTRCLTWPSGTEAVMSRHPMLSESNVITHYRTFPGAL